MKVGGNFPLRPLGHWQRFPVSIHRTGSLADPTPQSVRGVSVLKRFMSKTVYTCIKLKFKIHWTLRRRKNSCPFREQYPGGPARSQSLYRVVAVAAVVVMS